MAIATIAGEATRNHLLACLPPEEQARLRPTLERVELESHDVLSEPGERISHVYFPETGVISLIAVMHDGSAVEAGTVGNEGVAGVSAFLGADSFPIRMIAQVPGDALRMRVEAFRSARDTSPSLGDAVLRYTQALLVQMAQSAACNRLHAVDARAARWLLMTHDRVDGDDFHLTQDFLAMMLGVHRPTVTITMRVLQKAGLITYTRGHVTVLDRRALEEASCECYAVIQGEFERMIDGPSRPMLRVTGAAGGASAARR